MKGYSFDELVKLAMAAVKRAGDTMTGNLTTPKVLVSEAQGTESNALTRKDYVDAELAKKLNLTGGTLTGNLNTPRVLVSGVQGAEGNALTRKDYVDTELSRKLNLTGDTMTGALYVNEALHSRARITNDISSGARLIITPQGDSERFTIDMYPASSGAYQVMEFKGSNRTVSFKQIVSCEANPVAATHLTRKDYVDGQVATRAPTAHTHTVAAITDLAPQDLAANTYTLALRDGAADIHARLLRTTFGDESRIDGAIAFRVNNSNDNYTRYCNNPAAVRAWLNQHRTEWQMGWRAYIEHAENPMTEYHIPGKAAVITYLTGDGNYWIFSSNGSGGATAERLRLDPNGNLFTRGGIYEVGQRVYSPNNQPHYSHNHTAAQGNADIVAGGYGQIGTYALLKSLLNTNLGPGSIVEGNSLQYVSCSGASNYAAPSPVGTWKSLGIANAYKNNEGSSNTLWVRIA